MSHKKDVQEQNAAEIAELKAQAAAIKAELAKEVARFVAAYDAAAAKYQPVSRRLSELFSGPGPIHSMYAARFVERVKRDMAGIGQPTK
jgi:hypothetical protein